jgi:hypothetical protein
MTDDRAFLSQAFLTSERNKRTYGPRYTRNLGHKGQDTLQYDLGRYSLHVCRTGTGGVLGLGVCVTRSVCGVRTRSVCETRSIYGRYVVRKSDIVCTGQAGGDSQCLSAVSTSI